MREALTEGGVPDRDGCFLGSRIDKARVLLEEMMPERRREEEKRGDVRKGEEAKEGKGEGMIQDTN